MNQELTHKTMKRTMQKIFLMICFLFATLSWSQDYTEDMKKMTAFFLNEELAMNMDVVLFPTINSEGKVLGEAQLRKSGKHYYSSFLSNLLVTDGKHTLLVDKSAKEMLYYDVARQKTKQIDIASIDFEAIKNKAQKITHKGDDNGSRIYEIESKGQVIIKTIIQFKIATGALEKITYFYPEADQYNDYGAYKVEIDYTQVITQIDNKKVFDLDTYIQKKGKKVHPTASFKGYRIEKISESLKQS